MQSWMSATHEFFCRESMVSKMYSAPFSTCDPQHNTTAWTETVGLAAFSKKSYIHDMSMSIWDEGLSRESKRELYLQHKCVVFVRHLQRHGGPHLHDSRQRDAHFGFRWLQTQIHAIQIHTLYRMTFSDIDIQCRPKLVVKLVFSAAKENLFWQHHHFTAFLHKCLKRLTAL